MVEGHNLIAVGRRSLTHSFVVTNAPCRHRRMRRIVLVIPTLDRSGAEKQLVMLARGLPRDEFEVHVAALTRLGPLAAELVEGSEASTTVDTFATIGPRLPAERLTLIGKRAKLDPLAYWKLRRHIRQLKPEVVHTWLFAANSYGRAAALAERVPKLVAAERSVDPWKRPHELAIDRWLARRTNAIVVNSGGVRDFYVHHGLPVEKMVLIANGVAPASSAGGMKREALLEELGLPAGSRLIGGIGRLWPQKRVKDLIWAADLLKVIRDDVHLLLIGDGPQRARLERFRDQVRIGDKVHFLGARDDVPSILPHLDLLWLASEYEGMPNVVMEAMAAARPVVATDIAGTRDLVIDGQTGYLVPVGDRAALAREANRILKDETLATRLGQSGRERIEREFSVANMVDRHAKLYREI